MARDPSRHASAASSEPTTPSSSPGFFSSARHPPPPTKSAMGQAESAARPSPVLAPVALPPAQPAGKYRFAWPGRRKKSEDFTKVMGRVSPLPSPTSMPLPTPTATPPASVGKGKGRELTRQDTLASQADSDLHMQMHELGRLPSRSSAKQLTLQFASSTLHALKGKLNASQSSVHSLRSPATPPASPPPPLPPKPDGIRLSSSSSTHGTPYANPELPERKELPPQSSSTPTHITEAETRTALMPVVMDDDVKVPQRRERREDTQTARDIAEDWRKSDSTLRTVRLVGSRTPRPLSLAESTNSGHTVLPAAGSPSANMNASKRLSALMTDVDFGMPEVDSEDESVCESVAPSAFSSMHDVRDMHRQQLAQSALSSRPSPASSNQTGSRRSSLSIRIGRLSGSKARTVPSDHLSGSDSEAQSSVSTHGMHTANSSTTSITSSPSAKDSAMLGGRPSVEISSTASESSDTSDMQQYPQYQGKSKLEAWHKPSDSQTSFSTTSSHSQHGEQPSVSLSASHGPLMRPAHQRTRLQSIQSKGFRQTAVSLTTGLGPAAGFARKAVDKLGRALGGSTTSLDAPPLAGSHPPSASSASFFAMMGRTPAPDQLSQHHSHLHAHQRQHQAYGQSGVGHPPHHASKKALRKHAQNAPSGTWSIGSNSTSLSDTDGSAGQGLNLGRRVRASRYPGSRGIVFGRDLSECVQDTAIEGDIGGEGDMLKLEGRRLPALVTRCAQHILKWGVQEEGLFRISGRSTHVAKLRAEFDSGADYDMRECGPGEIDPHAVSSIFKAYLRELPEPLLTRELAHYFDAALSAENTLAIAAEAQSGDGSSGVDKARGPGLPAGPRNGMQVRKAPSLSTFAVPTLVPRVASGSLLSALAELIARLPRENRDLLRTVTELISATARCVRETKMPLSNLLLVFCPSLSMSPPLLRVLCEGEGIWDGPLKGVRGALITDDVVLDIRAPSPAEMKADETATDDNDEGEKGLRSQNTIRRTPRASYEVNEDAVKPDDSIAHEVTAMSPTTAADLDIAVNSPSTLSDPSSAGADSKKDSLLGTPFKPYSRPALNNSSGSLNTPPSSGTDSPASEPELASAAALEKMAVLRAQSDLPSPATSSVRKSLIGHPVPFPLGTGGTGGSMPVTPVEQSNTLPAHLRISTYSSSSPNLRSSSPGPTSPSSLNRRKSKASLHSLFPKRSLSSLLGLSQQQQQSVAISAPIMTLDELSPISLPEKRSATPCPVLELPVDMSSLHFGLDLGNVGSVDKPIATESSTAPGTMLRPKAAVMNRAASDSSALTSSIFYTPPTTVRALAPAMSSASSTSSGSYSFLDFNIGKSGDEDWATSVLQAAASDM